METRKIRITENDLKKLREAISEASRNEYRNSIYVRQLEAELDRAEIVDPRQMPPDVVTMNSKVVLTDLAVGEQMVLKLVYPEDSTTDDENVSVLAPIGTAMIGYRVGDSFEWDTPGGKSKLRVDQILYQPESNGIFD